MTLREKQSEFVRDVAKLIDFATKNGIELTFGETFRTKEQHEIYLKTGKSKKINSLHLMRLAVDFNFFINGNLTYEKKDIQILGDFWESLSPLNKWGGNWNSFKDCPHFEKT